MLFFTKLNYRCGSWWKILKYPAARLMYNDFAHSYYSMQDKLLQHTEIHRALTGLLIEFLFWISCKEIRFHYPLSIYTWFLTFSSLMNLIFSLFQTWILQFTAGRKIQFKLENKSKSNLDILVKGHCAKKEIFFLEFFHCA